MSDYIGTYEPGQTAASGGFAWYASMPVGVNDWLIPLLNQQSDMFGHSLGQIMLHVVSMWSDDRWFDGLREVLDRHHQHGYHDCLQIERTGTNSRFRKNPKVLEKISRITSPSYLLSGAFVGLLQRCRFAWYGWYATGTGLLLAVGIILRTYEQIQKEQAMEMHPMLRQFFGAE